MRECAQPRTLTPLVFGIAAAGWLALLVLERLLPGGELPCHGNASVTFLGTQPGSTLGGGLFFLGGWAIMTVAMMLPTVLPLAGVAGRKAQRSASPGRLFSCLVAGYVFVWLVFGLLVLGVANLSGPYLRPLLTQPWAGPHLPAAALFALAGIFQFLPVKRRCLETCRSHMRSAGENWDERRVMWSSVRLGIRHGVACAGSCGALMLLMFAVESAHLVWMLVLAIVMAVEKNSSWGPRLARPLGLLLLTCGAWLFLSVGRFAL